MKRKLPKTIVATTALVLLTASALADAACRRNTCYQQYNQCRASGIPLATCYGAYEDCLIRHGCQIP